jgi:hypothetical protein
MTDPKRLLEEGTALEATLLGAALDDAPRKGLDRRVQAALGIGGIAISASTASTTAAAASKAAPLLLSLGIAKWAGIAVIGAGAVVGAAAVVHHESARSTPPSAIAAAARTTPAPAVPAGIEDRVTAPPPPVPLATAAAPEPTPSPSPVANRSATPAANTTNAPEAPTQSKPALSDELRLVDGATRAIESGDAELALALLDRHDLEFLHGQMAPEALELRVRAYALRHDDVKVGDLGRGFLARYPDSPLVPRVRALVLESEGR